METIYDPTHFGDIRLGSRVVMSPMGRRRADTNGTPNEQMAAYYRQRASAGLIIVESTHPSWVGKNQPGSPHIITEDDARAWETVVEGVHEAGGTIVLQLMHAGGIAHPSVNGGRAPVAPSDVIPVGDIRVGTDMLPHARPRTITSEDAETIADEFATAAQRAVAVGFDGVEIHAGNGYLLHQFFSPHTNTRRDQHGGTARDRCRFPLSVVRAVTEKVGASRVGMRISPGASITSLNEPDVLDQYGVLLAQPEITRLAYLHTTSSSDPEIVNRMRSIWHGKWVHNMGTDPNLEAHEVVAKATATLLHGADAVSIGRLFISNPDLPRRLAAGSPLNIPDFSSFYTGGSKGYTDYAPLVPQAAS